MFLNITVPNVLCFFGLVLSGYNWYMKDVSFFFAGREGKFVGSFWFYLSDNLYVCLCSLSCQSCHVHSVHFICDVFQFFMKIVFPFFLFFNMVLFYICLLTLFSLSPSHVVVSKLSCPLFSFYMGCFPFLWNQSFFSNFSCAVLYMLF